MGPVFDLKFGGSVFFNDFSFGHNVHIVRYKSGFFDGLRNGRQIKFLPGNGCNGDPVFLKINTNGLHAIQACEGVFDALRSGQSLHAFCEDPNFLQTRRSPGRLVGVLPCFIIEMSCLPASDKEDDKSETHIK